MSVYLIIKSETSLVNKQDLKIGTIMST